MRNKKHDTLYMNSRWLKTLAVLLILLPVSVSAQNTAYVSTYAELSAAISNASINNIVVTANIDVPCETSGNAGPNSTDLSGTSTAQLIINRSLTLQSQAGNKYMLKRVPASGANSSYLKSMIAIRGNGHENNGTDNNTENTIEVSFTNIIIDGGANRGDAGVCQRRNGPADAYGNAGRSMIDVYLGGILNLEDGVELRNGFTTKSDNSLLNDASTSQCFGGAVRVDYHNETGGGTVNIKAGAIIHDCATFGSHTGYGGALGAYNYARLNLYGGTISNCTSAHGGAIACTYRGADGYGSSSAGTIRMYGGTISNCCAKYGGAISMDGSVTNYLLGGTIENCSASSQGSAIYIPESGTTVNMVAYNSNLLTITNCTGGTNTPTENTGGYAGVYKHESATIAETPVYHVTFQNNNTNFAILHVLQGDSLGEAFPAAPVNANFRFVGWYNGNTQVTSSTTITGNMTVTAKWDFLGNGTEGDPYLVPSVDVWNFLADQVNGGNIYSNKFFRQTGDFTITRMVGATINANGGDLNAEQFITFNGTYDGYGHTLTANLNVTGERYVGPFHCVSDATIKNLIVIGSVTVSGGNKVEATRHPSALIGCCRTGSVVIENCRVSANVSGADYMGGLIGHSWHANVTMTGCVYSGTLTANGSNYTGGLIGWGGDGGGKAFVFSNNIFTGSYSGSGKFHPVGVLCTTDNNPRTVTNTYYTAGLKNMTDDDGHSLVKGLPYTGEHAYSITGGTGVTVAAVGTPTPTYNVSGLSIYGSNGFAFNGVRYGAQGDEISLNLSGAEHYAATTGTLSGTANPYTLTMAAANSEIVLPVASVTTSSNVTSYHATLASAVSAWEANSTLTLLADVTTSSTIVVSNTSTLDLNGHGIKMTGTGPVIRVGAGKTFTLNDSDPTTTHRFSVNNSTLLATLDEENGTLIINGGYITGGRDRYGSAIDVSTYISSSFIMNAGTLIGNVGNGLSEYDSHGTVCVAHDEVNYFNTFTMNGGAICYNDAVGIGVLPDGTAYVNGGTIHHNNGTGIKMWRSHLLSLNNVTITDNTASGISVDAREALIRVQGRTIITNNTLNSNPADINYDSGDQNRSRPLAIVGALHSEARMGIYYNTANITPGVFTYGLDGNGNTSNFFSNNAGYVVGLNTSDEAYLHVPYTVTYNGNGNDGGTVPTDAATYAGGVAVTIPSAVPTKTGYTFTGWLNSVDNNTYAAGDNFTITANTILTAQWTINNYTITANAAPSAGGTVEGGGSYNHFATCELTATANEGYFFVNWTEGGAEVSTSATYGFGVSGDRTLTANFDTNAYALTVTVAGGQSTWGTVTGSNPAAKRFKGHTISATPATDYHFVQWQDGNSDNPRTVTVTQNTTYTATFAIDQYRIDSIRTTWQVKIGNASPIYPTPYVTVNPTAADTLGYVMIPVGSEFVIIPSPEQKPLVSKLELVQSITISNNNETFTVWFILGDTWAKALARQENNGCGLNDNNLQTILSVSIDDVIDPNINYGINNN